MHPFRPHVTSLGEYVAKVVRGIVEGVKVGLPPALRGIPVQFRLRLIGTLVLELSSYLTLVLITCLRTFRRAEIDSELLWKFGPPLYRKAAERLGQVRRILRSRGWREREPGEARPSLRWEIKFLAGLEKSCGRASGAIIKKWREKAYLENEEQRLEMAIAILKPAITSSWEYNAEWRRRDAQPVVFGVESESFIYRKGTPAYYLRRFAPSWWNRFLKVATEVINRDLREFPLRLAIRSERFMAEVEERARTHTQTRVGAIIDCMGPGRDFDFKAENPPDVTAITVMLARRRVDDNEGAKWFRDHRYHVNPYSAFFAELIANRTGAESWDEGWALERVSLRCMKKEIGELDLRLNELAWALCRPPIGDGWIWPARLERSTEECRRRLIRYARRVVRAMGPA